MAIKFGNSITLNGFQIMNFRVHVSNVAPSSPNGGSMWFDDINKALKYYNGTGWLSPITVSSAVTANNIPQWSSTSGMLSNGLSLQTTLRATGVATDTSLATEKAIRDAIDSIAGVTSHSALTNLNADDHLQYYNQTRGDARYERLLGNPAVDGYVLVSTVAGVRSWVSFPTGGGMVYPSAGIAVSTGSSWGTSIVNNSTNWNTAYSWGNHSTVGYMLTTSFNSLFELVGTAPNQYIRCKYPFAGDYEIQAWSDTGWLPPTIWEAMPLATTTSIGGIIYVAGGTRFLREDGTWQTVTTGSSMVYPGAGIPVSTGAAWTTSIANNSTNWNTAYSWGNHAGLYRPVSWVPSWSDVTSKPLTFTPSAHQLDSITYHTVSGLTTGHFLKASSPTTFGFAALTDTEIKTLLADWFVLEGTAPNQYIRCKYPFAGDYEIQAWSDTGWLPPTIWESMPVATSTSVGGIQLGTLGTRFLREDGTWQTVSGGGGGTVITSGTPVDNQVAVFTNATTIEGHTGFTYNSVTGYLDVASVIRTSGNLQHLTLQAGHASGAAGSDAGNITIKAGDAINADSASVAGALYLVPGNLYATGGSGIIYLGDSTNINTRVSFRTIGTPTNISIEFIPKGDGSVILGGYTTYIMGALSMGESIQINEGYRLLTPEILGRNGTGPLTIKAAGGYLGSPNGRDLMLYGGTAYSGGVNGNIYFGTGSVGYLPVKSSETNIIYYDTATGKISYGAAPSGGSMVYPSAGIALSTGSAWGTSITNNSANWNTAYGWGNHASVGYLTTISKAQVEAVLTGTITSHNHSGTYQPAHANLTSLAGLSYVSASFVKMTAAGTFTLDTNTYPTGSGSNTRIAYWSSANNITSNSNFTYDGSILTIANGIRLTAPSSGTGSGTRTYLTAGESLVFGNLVYMKNDGKVWKANASSATTAPVIGICMNSVAANGSADILLSGRVYNSSWSLGTGGDEIYLNTSAGTFSISAPSGVTGYVVQVLGVVLSSNTIYFNPSLTQIVLA